MTVWWGFLQKSKKNLPWQKIILKDTSQLQNKFKMLCKVKHWHGEFWKQTLVRRWKYAKKKSSNHGRADQPIGHARRNQATHQSPMTGIRLSDMSGKKEGFFFGQKSKFKEELKCFRNFAWYSVRWIQVHKALFSTGINYFASLRIFWKFFQENLWHPGLQHHEKRKHVFLHLFEKILRNPF